MDDSRRIENLIYSYAERIDNGDLEGVAELFRCAAIVAPLHDSRVEGYDEVLAMYQGACRIFPDTSTPKTRHITTNVIIEVKGDAATARCAWTVIQATQTLVLQPIMAGRYQDSFVKSGPEWRFEQRCMFVDFVGNCSEHLLYNYEQPSSHEASNE